ncbi:hypothetical protein HYX01_04895 [Candidatus Woesearchaeota archaeon]|nr:hypothetical protein [Candidatus Woesearchaeota archaeon]
MKKLLFFPIIFLLSLSVVFAASVNRNMPSKVEPSVEVEVILTLSGVTVGEAVAIEDSIPNTITLKSWEISGSKETKDAVSHVMKASQKEGFDRHSWAFTASSSSPAVTYKFDAPSVLGSYEFDVRWVTKEGFSHQASTLTVRTISCGDGVCEGNENSDNCEKDCPKKIAAPVEVKPQPVQARAKAPVGWVVAAVVLILGIVLLMAYQKKKKQQRF